jgi:hypothetical protein
MIAEAKARKILDILSNRSGFGDTIDNLDEETLEEIVEEIRAIIKA